LFESSVAIGEPRFAESAISRVRQIYPFGPLALLVLFIASCLFIGQVFFLMSWLADMLIGFGYSLSRYTLGSQWLYRLFAKLQGFPPKQNIFIRLLSRLIFRTRQRIYIESRPVLKCLHFAVTQLLKRGYGIDRTQDLWHSDGGEWRVWYSVLGKPLKGFQEALMTMRTILGCGLAGFSALYVSSALRERYFITLCVVFTFTGCFLSIDLAKWKMDPIRSSYARLRAVLLELSETCAAPGKQTSRPQKSPDVAVGANTDEDG